MNREKVIKGLEDSLQNQGCGYMDGVGDLYAVSGEDLQNALALLKEHEKRNESVAPICSQEIFGTFLVCGNCGEKLENVLEAESIDDLPIKWKYCRKCGREIKWDEC